MLKFLSILCLTVVLAPISAEAQRRPVVVELYTSQGCSSCPPADALLSELAALDGVIALALHVDYWDYLGWIDQFGKRAHTARQLGYKKAMRRRSVYTPQMIVQGQDMMIGHRAAEIRDSIAAHLARPPRVSLTVVRELEGLLIALAPLEAEVGPADVQLVTYRSGATVTIAAGENAGRRIDYSNIVTDWAKVGRWDGAAAVELRVPVTTTDPLAVIVQSAGFGPILNAAKLD